MLLQSHTDGGTTLIGKHHSHRYCAPSVLYESNRHGFEITNGGQPVYRFNAPSTDQHFFGLNPTPPYGYYLEGIGFYTFVTDMTSVVDPVPALASFDELYNPDTDHLLYIYGTEEDDALAYFGFYFIQSIGGIAPNLVYSCNPQGCGVTNTIPLYRVRKTDYWFWSTSWPEIANTLNMGWIYEGVAGYLPTGP